MVYKNRVIYFFRGISGSGKSNFVKKYHLEEFTISSDNIRLLLGYGRGKEIDQEKQFLVWDTVKLFLNSKMANGVPVILDATNLTDLSEYTELVEDNGYRAYIVNFDYKNNFGRCNKNRPRPVPTPALNRQKKQYDKIKEEGAFPIITPDEVDLTTLQLFLPEMAIKERDEYTVAKLTDRFVDETMSVARSMFLKRDTLKVVARIFNKFWFYNENMSKGMNYPLRVRTKFNGFLGVIGYDKDKDEVVYFSKGDCDKESLYVKNLTALAKDYKDILYKDLTENPNTTIICEVLAPSFNRHATMKDGDKDELKFLGRINNLNGRLDYFDKTHPLYSFDEHTDIVIQNAKELVEFIDEQNKNWNDRMEGFVLQDRNRELFKYKFRQYYELRKDFYEDCMMWDV